MKTDFDFDKVGKRMPYKVPEHFFGQLEADIFQQIQEKQAVGDSENISLTRRNRLIPIWVKLVAAVVAVVAFVGGGSWLLSDHEQAALSEVEQAFSNLSVEDQDYMLAVYQEDIFLNE